MASIREIRRAYEAGIKDGLRDIGNVCLEQASEIIAAEAVDRGDVLASGQVEAPKRRSIVVKWTAAHAKYVNWGTRPHWPPLAPILAWVKRNLRRFTDTSGASRDVIKPSGRIAERARRAPEAVALRVARGVQAKIAREGTAPVYFAQKGAREAMRQAPGLLQAALDERLGRL